MTTDVELYLESLVEKGWISEKARRRAIEVFRELCSRARSAPTLTNVAPGPDELVEFAWRTPNHRLTIDLRGDGSIEAFHENLRTGELWSDEGHTVPDQFLDRLECVTKEAPTSP